MVRVLDQDQGKHDSSHFRAPLCFWKSSRYFLVLFHSMFLISRIALYRPSVAQSLQDNWITNLWGC